MPLLNAQVIADKGKLLYGAVEVSNLSEKDSRLQVAKQRDKMKTSFELLI